MCKCDRIFRNITLEKCSKISFVFNLLLMLLNIVIIFLTLLCFIQDKYGIIFKTEMLTFINNIFCCLVMIILIIYIEYYRCKNLLMKRKIKACFIFIIACNIISAIKFIEVFDSITKINRYKLLFNINKTIYNDYTIQLSKQLNNQKKYLIIIAITFIVQLILSIMYIIALFNMNIIFINHNIIVQIDDRNCNESTEVDISNNDENIINNLNIDKIKYKYYLSENIINKIEKVFKEQATQTKF